MKTSAQLFLFRLGVKFFFLLVLAIPKLAAAQGILNALTVDVGSTVVGYTLQGVGWSFIPTADLIVTGISSTAPQVNFWLGTNQVVAAYNYDGPYGGPPNFAAPTNFQPVSSILLSAGQTYFLSTQQSNFTSFVSVFVYGLNPSGSPYDPKTFSLSPYISQFSSYYLSSSGQWSSTSTPGYPNTSYVPLGPNFQFQVVPEPTLIELSILMAGACIFWKRNS